MSSVSDPALNGACHVTPAIIPNPAAERQPNPEQIRTPQRDSDDAYPYYVQDVLSRFEGLHREADGWVCRCLSHQDSNPSLRISVGDGGKLLLHCRGGCAVEDVLAAAGLCFRDLWPGENEEPMQPLAPEAASWTVSDADADYRNEVYGALLAALVLSEAHRAALRHRGFSDAQIDLAGYKTLGGDLTRLLGQLYEQFGDRLAAVPGFIAVPGGEGARLATDARGVAIPVRDRAKRVIALKVRRDSDAGGRGKYVYVSGGDSPSCGAPCHVPLAAVPRADGLWRVAEGPLAADVATALSDVPTIGVAGVTTWRHAVPVLELLGAKQVRVAFDAPDLRNNPGVRRQVAAFVQGLRDVGITPAVEVWDGQKGIDDQLAAGGTTSVVPAGGVDAYLARLDGQPLAALPAAERVPAEPVSPSRLAAVLKANGKQRPRFEFPDPVTADVFVAGDAGEVEWLWGGYLARGEITLLSAKPKAGKTTLVAALLGATCRGEKEFLGRKLEPRFRTLIVTQEKPYHWKLRIERHGYDPDLILFQPGRDGRSHPGKAMPMPAWEALWEHLARKVKELGVGAVLLDTTADFWPVKKEADPAEITAAMAPVEQVTEVAGGAVLAVHHDRKGGGEGVDAIRGSGQLAGYVAIPLGLKQSGPEGLFRTLTSESRYDDTPKAVTFRREEGGRLAVVGGSAAEAVTATREAQAAADDAGVVAHLVANPGGLTVAALAKALNVARKTAQGRAERVFAAGGCLRTGEGKKNDPVRYLPLAA